VGLARICRALARDSLAAALSCAEAWSISEACHGRALPALVLHLAAALLGLALLELCLGGRASARSVLGPLLLILALPGLGALIVVGVLLPACRRELPAPALQLVEREPLPLPDQPLPISAPPRVLRDVLATSDVLSERLGAVLALRRLPARQALPLLRLAFSDASEDVRLLAFADLERRESKLRAQIRATRETLDESPDLPESWRAHLEAGLAQHHWELVYGGFITGALEASVLETAGGHAERSFWLGARGDAAVLRARIALRQAQPRVASLWLHAAEEAGVAPQACAPLRAEVAYMERDFAAVARFLSAASPSQLRRPGLHAVLDFWNREAAS
jgi:hypothetical protein